MAEAVMSYSMTLVKFQSGRMASIRQDVIVAVLVRHGCRVPELREGRNEVGLPHDKPTHSPFGESALLSIKDGEVTSFGLHRPQATRECRGLLFSLIDELKLTMFPEYGSDLFAREDMFSEIPRDILHHFSNLVVVKRPEDCV
jgi:hypothetical protein